jgi:electron transfer flavoprotein alpha subunit
MEGNQNILIFGEMDGDKLSSITTQIMRIGKSLSGELNQELGLVFLSGDSPVNAKDGYGYGADKVYVVADPQLENYMTDSYLQAMEQVIEELKPAVIIFGQTDIGLDLAPRLGFRLKTGVTLDCVDIKADPDKGSIEVIKPVFGGKAHSNYSRFETLPQIASVRDGSFDTADFDESKGGEVTELGISLDSEKIRTKFIKKEEDANLALALKLATASVVVSGGRGLKKKEGVDIIQETADLLDGALAGSRPAVDNGWVPTALQIGITGKKVNPQVYMAVGISGALQHMAGCSKSKVIVAVNSDDQAPIFKFSHYGAVGDYKEIIQAFNDEVKKSK